MAMHLLLLWQMCNVNTGLYCYFFPSHIEAGIGNYDFLNGQATLFMYNNPF